MITSTLQATKWSFPTYSEAFFSQPGILGSFNIQRDHVLEDIFKYVKEVTSTQHKDFEHGITYYKR